MKSMISKFKRYVIIFLPSVQSIPGSHKNTEKPNP